MQQLWSVSFWCTCSFFGYVKIFFFFGYMKILKLASDLKFRGVCVWLWCRKWACCLCNLNFRRGNLFLCPSLGDWGRGEKRTTSLLVSCLLPIHLYWIFSICPTNPLSILEASVLWIRTLNAMDNFSGTQSPCAREIRRRGKGGVLAVPPSSLPVVWAPSGCLPWTGIVEAQDVTSPTHRIHHSLAASWHGVLFSLLRLLSLNVSSISPWHPDW